MHVSLLTGRHKDEASTHYVEALAVVHQRPHTTGRDLQQRTAVTVTTTQWVESDVLEGPEIEFYDTR